jgi:hypothetical protein
VLLVSRLRRALAGDTFGLLDLCLGCEVDAQLMSVNRETFRAGTRDEPGGISRASASLRESRQTWRWIAGNVIFWRGKAYGSISGFEKVTSNVLSLGTGRGPVRVNTGQQFPNFMQVLLMTSSPVKCAAVVM